MVAGTKEPAKRFMPESARRDLMAHGLSTLLGRVAPARAGRLPAGEAGTGALGRPVPREFPDRRHEGPLALLLRPVGLVLALLLLILGLSWIGTGYVRS